MAGAAPPCQDTLVWQDTLGSHGAPARALGIEGLVDTQYYEVRLAEGQDQVDYLCAFAQSAATRVEKVVSARAFSGGDVGAWTIVLRSLRGWFRHDSLAQRRVPLMWFEFDDVDIDTRSARATDGLDDDDAHDDDALNAPSISVCIVPGYQAERELGAVTPHDLPLAHEVLRALGWPATRSGSATLGEVFRQLPAGGRWIHVSRMLGREPAAVKLYGSVPRLELGDYLRRIAWSGDVTALERTLDELYPRRLVGDAAFIDLNLDNHLDPGACSLGVAVSQQQLWQGSDPDPRRASILERWVDAGLCSSAKAAALQRWPRSPSDGVRRRNGERRFVDLKLVWQEGRGVTAKGYLGAHSVRRIF